MQQQQHDEAHNRHHQKDPLNQHQQRTKPELSLRHLRLRLRSTRLRQCRAFQQPNREQNRDHWRGEDYHHHYEQQENVHSKESLQGSSGRLADNKAERKEYLPRRGNYPGFATYRYRDLIARQQEKWNRAGKAKGQSSSKVASPPAQPSEYLEEVEADERPRAKGRDASGSQPKATRSGGGSRKCTNGRSKATGADLYVARMTRSGTLGNAMPCWRCLEWCKWAGVKRVFHYSIEEEDQHAAVGKGKGKEKAKVGKWICVKVNDVRPEDCYWTQGDGRILGYE
ncbi:hypothetical protein M408DRAFT_232497 [Serendipita vermifera MAFF 305830]|uniref:CMP/dCMP-type deaminase domain-containing protein n=1 Tax=Serendipita vermifera MAFF 305830 TaxID=933852 RepID=A0A0C2WDH5_SERVB|nr:hypothetical protein M408DRAFT_232497 [Serendipita vermifera MAFF 305830]